jgi:uncharacterized membrane protein
MRLWYEDGWRSALRFALISAGVFVAINAPFLLDNFGAWFRGTFQPMLDSMVWISDGGLSEITHSGFAYLPKSYYSLVTLSVFALLVFVYWRHYDALHRMLWIAPAVVMWFSYRNLTSYWYFWLLPALAALLLPEQPASPYRSRRWRGTLGVTGGAAAALALLGVGLSLQHHVDVRLAPFADRRAGRVSE